jgi:uncharacterized membrane protein YhaH (DUF805 family)
VKIDELWSPSGTIGRGTYALTGLIGIAIKHNLDRLVATIAFNKPWGVFNYWIPIRDVPRITQLGGSDAKFLATMVALSLPFIWVGVALTMKRLRSAGLPVQFVLWFFLPVLNLLFFLLLCLIPEQSLEQRSREPKGQPSPLARMIPSGKLGSAAYSLLIVVPVGLATAVLGAQVLTHYGWGIFVALPFTMGFISAIIYGIREPRSLGSCVGVACLSVILLGAALLGFALEGAFCLLMALPVALPLAAFGGACGYVIQKRDQIKRNAPAFLSVLVLFAPGVEWVEHATAVASPAFVVRSSIDVQAPPERVWEEVVAFTEIPPPTEWFFRAGVAYPIRAEMFGTGAGAERHCVFSTGAFVEPIQVWDAPHRLKFSVTSNPAPMEEWTPYTHIEPPHLHGFLVSEGGQFLLTPLPNGGTRLEGTTWYRHGLRPSTYWKIWSDAIIHRIHMRVLRHIRDEVEARSSPLPH